MQGDLITRLQRRVHELERLCSEAYVAGTELGLPRALIDRLWSIRADGNVPVASRLEAAPDPERSEPGRTPATAGHLKPLLPGKRVLVVDDDPLMVEVLLRILSRENFETLSAGSGPEALERSAGQDLDLLITDFHMPEMTGPVLADRLRRRLPDLRVLYQTGFSDQLFEGRDELAEGEAFLEKPFSATGLREAARLVLFDRLNP